MKDRSYYKSYYEKCKEDYVDPFFRRLGRYIASHGMAIMQTKVAALANICRLKSVLECRPIEIIAMVTENPIAR